MPTCINIRELYGDCYRIGHDPVAVTPSGRKDPWLMTIPCRRGAVIYPHGGDLLAVEIDYRPHIAKRLAAIPGVRLHQSGDGERTFLFPVERFDQVAELVRPKRRPRLTPEQRAERTGRLAAWREKASEKSGISRLEPPHSPPDGQKATSATLTPI